MRVACPTQKTTEWFEAKLGRVSASNIHLAMDYVNKGSAKWGDKRVESSAARNKYIRQLAAERIIRLPTEHYVSKAMDHGNSFEAEARRAYSLRRSCLVEQTGFVLHPTLDFLGASPDGLVLPTHVVELKCPAYDTHLQYLDTGIFPKEYVLQVQCTRLCCGLQYGELVSYYAPDPQLEMPYLPERFRMVIKHIEPDAEIDRQIEEAAIATMEEVVATVARWSEPYPEMERKEAPKHEQNLDTGGYLTEKDFEGLD